MSVTSCMPSAKSTQGTRGKIEDRDNFSVNAWEVLGIGRKAYFGHPVSVEIYHYNDTASYTSKKIQKANKNKSHSTTYLQWKCPESLRYIVSHCIPEIQ